MRAPAENPTYKLDRTDVKIVAMLAEMGLWSNTAIGKAYGIHRSAVLKHRKRYYPKDSEMKRLYIQEDNPDLGEEALYGPFSQDEISERLNDRYADLLAEGLANINCVSLTDEEAAKLSINPREFWMSQLADLEKDSNAQEDHHVQGL